MSTTDVFNARVFRLAFAFAAAIAAATLGAFVLIYFQVSSENTRRVGAILENEARINAEAGEDRLQEALAARQMPDIRRIDYIALLDAHGALVVGNLSRTPTIAVDGLAHLVAAEDFATTNGEQDTSLFVARRRADGGLLLLGRGLSEQYDVENTLMRALAVAVAPTVLLILAIGVVFARRVSRRLHSVYSAITRIMDGDLASRLPVSRHDDEVNGVATAVNVMLDEISRLLNQLKSVGDNIAHDLRTPLAVARAKLERARDDVDDPRAARALVAEALDQLDRASVIIAALLRISAVENKPRERRFQDVDLAALCAQAHEFYQPLAEAKSVELTVSGEDKVLVSGDADLMREAISNLVDNAIKFTPAGGAAHIMAGVANGRPFIEVRDTGPGVAPTERDKIFRRFYRAASNAGAGGHGLGLNIAQTIAQLHGFELTVEDNEPGARFVMRAAEEAPTHGKRRPPLTKYGS